MIAAFSPFVALRYLVTRRINLLAALGVMFAVWAILVVDSVFTGFVAEIRTDVRHSAPDLLVTGLPHDTSYELVRQAIAAAGAEVVAQAPRLRHHGMFQPLRQGPRGVRSFGSSQVDFDHTENGFAQLLGIDPLAEEAVTGLRSWLVRAPEEFALRPLAALPSTHGVSPVLDERDPAQKSRLRLPPEVEWQARRRAGLPVEPQVADHRASWPGMLLGWRRIRNAPGVQAGDPFDLVCASFPRDAKGEVQLHTHSLRVAFAGWFASGHRMFDETEVLVPIETLRTLLGHDATDPLAIDLVTDVAVRLRADLLPAQRAAVAPRLQAAVQAVLPAGSAPCLVVDWEGQNTVFLSAVAHEQGMMQFVLFVVMLVAAFVIYATLHMMVTQKIKDIGILAAIGGTPRGIGAVFLIGGLCVALVGTALGTGLGIASAIHLNGANEWFFAHTGLELFPRRLFDLRAVPCHLEPSWIAQVAVLAVVLALLVAVLPARKAARLHPVEALSYE
ncbi:MAG: FtsX-like permease family protein [Planctomycetota bacterium]